VKRFTDLGDMLRRANDGRRPNAGMRLYRGGKEVERLVWSELANQAGRAGAALAARGVTSGARVAVVLPTSSDFLRAVFATLAAGATPVPLPAPLRFASTDRYLVRVQGALEKSRVKTIVTSDAVRAALAHGAATDGLDIVTVAELLAEGREPRWAAVQPADAALVQYTSGSTSTPRGVVLSHAQILANIEAISKEIAATPDDGYVCWLPLFHDMGLIGGIFSAVHAGADSLLLPTEEFVRSPAEWLGLFREGGTISPAPNSGYLQCVRRIAAEEVARLDLSRWRAALSGSEPVDPTVLRAFATHFAPAGFRAEVLMPVYGLAEATLAVAFPPLGRGLTTRHVDRQALGEGRVVVVDHARAGAVELASVGRALPGLDLAILDPDRVPVSAGRVGEIFVRGPSIMGGYDRDPAASGEALHDGWLATGDLGFFHDGELFIAGRRKEVLIVQGQKFYAHDIEQLCAAVEGVLLQGVLAFGLAGEGTEAVALLVETREADPARRSQIVRAVRDTVSQTLGLPLADVVLVARGTVPRTSSGKLARGQARGVYEAARALSPPAGEA